MRIRDAEATDAARCAQIYAPYVRDTAITFELEAPTAAQLADRIAAAQQAHAWLVADRDGVAVGYAYAGPYKQRPAYRFACEVSIYIDAEHRGGGLGRALYTALFARLAARGYRILVAGMTLPNEASEGLHRELGFEPVGVWRSIGWKHGAWHDVAWCQRAVGPAGSPPAELR